MKVLEPASVAPRLRVSSTAVLALPADSTANLSFERSSLTDLKSGAASARLVSISAV
jgi:hypothetical protein